MNADMLRDVIALAIEIRETSAGISYPEGSTDRITGDAMNAAEVFSFMGPMTTRYGRSDGDCIREIMLEIIHFRAMCIEGASHGA